MTHKKQPKTVKIFGSTYQKQTPVPVQEVAHPPTNVPRVAL